MSEIRFELKPVAEKGERRSSKRGRSGMRFELKPVAEKPKRRFRKGSKYDPILDRFIEGEHDLVEVEVKNRNASYIRINLANRIKKRGLEDRVEASVVNGVLYLEKV